MSWFSAALKGTGHALAKPMGVAQRVAGTVGGAMIGGPAGAMAGYRLGDKLGNIYEDALGGHDVKANLGSNLVGAAQGAAGAYGASKLPNNGGIMNVGRTGPSAGGGIADASVGGDGSGGGWRGTLGSAGGFLKDHLGSLASSALGGGSGGGGGINPMIWGLAGLQTANAAHLGKTANDYSDKAFDLANQSYTDRAGLRSAGINTMLHPTPPSTANLSAIRGSNPYAQPAQAQPPIPLAGAA